MLKIDAKSLIAQVKQAKSDKRKISLYVSGGIYDAFKSACEKQQVSPSEVTEELMKAFIDSLSGAAGVRPKKA